MVALLPPVVDNKFGWVMLAAVGNIAVHQIWMSLRVMKARKRYGVFYPELYASADNKNAKQFNCVQRAHQNSLEAQPAHLISTILLGTQYPVFAAATSLLVTLGRIVYFRGYSSGEPNKRKQGGFWILGAFAQWGGIIYAAVNLLRA